MTAFVATYATARGAPIPSGPALVDRRAELAELEALLGEVSAPTVVLDGPAGIGKTTLAHAVAERAAAHGVRVLRCSAGERETHMSYAAVGDLLAPVLPDALALLRRPRRMALEVAMLLAEPSGAPPDQRAVALAIVDVLCGLARDGPVLLVIDDGQWLDGSSASVLAFAWRRVGALPVGFLVTVRGIHAAVPLGMDQPPPPRRVHRVRLGPLGPDPLATLLRQRLGGALSGPMLGILHDASGGNPFFALELARALADDPPRPGAPLRVPANLRSLVAGRLARLGHTARAALLAAAALSDPRMDVVEAAVPGAMPALAEADAASVIHIDGGRVVFAHPLVGSTLYADAGVEERRRMHRRLAELVVDGEERAHHLACGASKPDAAIAAELERAALHARSRAAPQAAARLAEQALELTPPELEAEGRRRRLQTGECEFLAGDTTRAQLVLEELVAMCGASDVQAAALHVLGELRSGHEGYVASAATLERALRAASDPSLRVRILVDLCGALLQSGNLRRADDHSAAALRLAERLGQPGPLAAALTNAAMTDFLLGRGLRADLVAHATALADVGTDVGTAFPPAFLQALLLKWSDRLEDARVQLDGLARRFREEHEERWIAFVLVQLGELECWMGDFGAAASHAEELMAATAQRDERAYEPLGLFVRASADAYRGRVDAARRSAARAAVTFEEKGNQRHLLRCLAVEGFCDLSAGDAHAARGALMRALELAEEAGYGEPGVLRFHHDAVEVLVALGELDAAERTAMNLTVAGQSLDRPWALATGGRSQALVAAARGDLEGAIGSLDAALVAHERLAQPFELARTELVCGAVHRRRREKRLAREFLTSALERFQALGTPLWATRTRAELGRIGGRAPSPRALTATELDVARLAVEGLTNREIAQSLFMSVKTVERHLSHSYDKLGIAGRRELRRVIAR